nr:hypothetical protein [Streptomyces sp. SA15]
MRAVVNSTANRDRSAVTDTISLVRRDVDQPEEPVADERATDQDEERCRQDGPGREARQQHRDEQCHFEDHDEHHDLAGPPIGEESSLKTADQASRHTARNPTRSLHGIDGLLTRTLGAGTLPDSGTLRFGRRDNT